MKTIGYGWTIRDVKTGKCIEKKRWNDVPKSFRKLALLHGMLVLEQQHPSGLLTFSRKSGGYSDTSFYALKVREGTFLSRRRLTDDPDFAWQKIREVIENVGHAYA